MFKHPSLLSKIFNKNNKSQENIFKHMCNFGERAEWRNGRIMVSYYLNVNTSNDKYRLVNPTPLECITGYIMEDVISDIALNSMTKQIINIIDGYISSYCSFLNSPEWLHMIKQENELEYD